MTDCQNFGILKIRHFSVLCNGYFCGAAGAAGEGAET